MKLYFSLLLLFLGTFLSNAQTKYVTVQSIEIIGNKKTREKIILRELDFEVGDTITNSNLTARLALNQTLLMNADLFNSVEIDVQNVGNDFIDLTITVVEDWYIFPLLAIDFADRNFNIWWVEQNRAFNRINLGLYLVHTNITGRKDYLKAVGQVGYTQRVHLYYSRPYLNKAQTLGALFNVFYARNHEAGYTTQNNVLQFHRDDDDYLLKRLYLDVGLNYRPEIRSKHQLTLSYRDYNTTEMITSLNPDFFLNGKERLQYFALDYQFRYDKRDFSRYPMKGYYLEVSALKEGLGVFDEINSLYVGGAVGKYWQAEKFSYGAVVRGRKGLMNQIQPYYNSRALGYEQHFVRGYEYYVIDGQDFIYSHLFARVELFNREINLGKSMPIKAFKTLPLKFYWRAYTDHGYVNAPFHSENNSLTNTYLRSRGMAIDMVLYHDYVCRLEYSVNHLNETGFYLHYNVSF